MPVSSTATRIPLGSGPSGFSRCCQPRITSMPPREIGQLDAHALPAEAVAGQEVPLRASASSGGSGLRRVERSRSAASRMSGRCSSARPTRRRVPAQRGGQLFDVRPAGTLPPAGLAGLRTAPGPGRGRRLRAGARPLRRRRSGVRRASRRARRRGRAAGCERRVLSRGQAVHRRARHAGETMTNTA